MTSIIRILTAATLVMALGVTACGGDDNPVLPGFAVPAKPANTSGTALAQNMENNCGTCDGDLGNAGITGVKGSINSLNDDDAEALLYLFREMQDLSQGDISGTDEFEARTNPLTEPTELTFNRTTRVNCNSTGQSGEALGDPSGGTITESLIWTGTFDDAGETDTSDNYFVATVSISNCVLSGDILDQTTEGVTIGDPAAIRLNGGLVLSWDDLDMPSPSDPEVIRVTGSVQIATDGDDDGVFGNEFWTHVVNYDSTETDDGSTTTYNGGVCAGEMVALGMDDDDDSDDSCATDTDSMNDAFLATGNFSDFDLWD